MSSKTRIHRHDKTTATSTACATYSGIGNGNAAWIYNHTIGQTVSVPATAIRQPQGDRFADDAGVTKFIETCFINLIINRSIRKIRWKIQDNRSLLSGYEAIQPEGYQPIWKLLICWFPILEQTHVIIIQDLYLAQGCTRIARYIHCNIAIAGNRCRAGDGSIVGRAVFKIGHPITIGINSTGEYLARRQGYGHTRGRVNLQTCGKVCFTGCSTVIGNDTSHKTDINAVIGYGRVEKIKPEPIAAVIERFYNVGRIIVVAKRIDRLRKRNCVIVLAIKRKWVSRSLRPMLCPASDSHQNPLPATIMCPMER